MAFTSLTSGQTDADSPIDQILMDLISDNMDDLDNRFNVLQSVNSIVSTQSSTTSLILTDNSIPQSGEGGQFLSLAITPNSASSNLLIEVVLNYSLDVTGGNAVMALFVDSDASAISAVSDTNSTAENTKMQQMKLVYFIASGSTSARTYKVRAGSDATGTFYVNYENGTSFFNSTILSSITITETP